MDNFLDTCIIIDNFNEKSKLHQQSKKFIQDEDNFVISEFQKIREIPYLFFRLKLRSKIIISKALIPNKNLPEIKKLNPRDKQEIKEVLSEYALGLKSIKELFEMKQNVFFLEKKLNDFIQNRIKRFVTPMEMINRLLVKTIESFNKNGQDAMIIASAIEEHQKNSLILITTDKKDWKQEYITKSCKDASYKKIPEVRFL